MRKYTNAFWLFASLLTGAVAGGSAVFFHTLASHDAMLRKYGSCLSDYNKVAMKMVQCQTDGLKEQVSSQEEVLKVTHELVLCKEAIKEMAREEAERVQKQKERAKRVRKARAKKK